MSAVEPSSDAVPRFRGPYADGPPASALRVDPPVLEHLQRRDRKRLFLAVRVVFSAVLRRLLHWPVTKKSQRPSLAQAASDGLIDGFIEMGPTYVKAGQIIASSGALFPKVMADAARRCLDAVPTFPTEVVHRTLEEDLGGRIEDIFESFDDVPLSAASIGQVHACVLLDGRDAVVKVQRPNIRELMAIDLRVAYRVAKLLDHLPWFKHANAPGIIRDLHEVTFQELTPPLEADRQDRFRQKIWAFGDNEQVTAPLVYWDYCGPRTICMERVYGLPMDDYDEIAARGYDGQKLLRRGAKVWAESVMVHGPFHGDMHAGNVWALEDGRGCFLDFGIMGELPEQWKQLLRDLFYSCGFDLDFTRVAKAYRAVGAIPAGLGTDEELAALLNNTIGPMLVNGFGSIDIAEMVTQSVQMLKAYDAQVPQELTLIAKQMLYVDKYTKHLAPNYSIAADPYIVKNIFPEEAAARAAELGIDLTDDAPLPLGMDAALDPHVERSATPIPAAPKPNPAATGDTVTYPFLSPEWIDAARKIRDDVDADRYASDAPEMTVNLTVTEVPFGSGTVEAHASNEGGVIGVDLGHVGSSKITIVVDHATARSLVIDQDPMLAMQAFMTGKIKIDGDLGALLGDGVNPMELMNSLNLGGGASLADVDPEMAAIADKIRAITA